MAKRFYITTPIYYVNDKPHIGHAYTTIAADVLARWHKLKGEEVFFLTGTDEHGAKIAERAESEGKKPQEFVDEIVSDFMSCWDELNISYNRFIRTTERKHIKAVQKALQFMYDKGDIYLGKFEGLYCQGCEQYKNKRDLVDGKCPDHGIVPERMSEESYMFKLSRYTKELLNKIKKDELEIRLIDRKNEIVSFYQNQGLEDVSFSRKEVKWGIPIPWDESHTIYVWADAFLNYLTGLDWDGTSGKYPKMWPADVQLMSKDILRVHATIWPAMLMSLNIPLPKKLFIHGFFTINGQKMSKSLGNVIDPNDLVKKFGADATRYLLLSQFPFGQDGDIKEDKFTEQYNADLANGIGNLASRILNLVVLHNKGQVPAQDDTIFFGSKGMAEWKVSTGIIEGAWSQIQDKMEKLDFSGVLQVVRDRIITPCNLIIDNTKPWESWQSDRENWEKLMYTLLEVLRHLGWIIRPFMPETSNKIFEQLGIPEENKKTLHDQIMQWGGLRSGTKIIKGKPLFPRM